MCRQYWGALTLLKAGKPHKSELLFIKKISVFTHLQSANGRDLPGGVGRRHMVLKCLGVVLQRSAEVVRAFPAEEPLEFWDDGWLYGQTLVPDAFADFPGASWSPRLSWQRGTPTDGSSLPLQPAATEPTLLISGFAYWWRIITRAAGTFISNWTSTTSRTRMGLTNPNRKTTQTLLCRTPTEAHQCRQTRWLDHKFTCLLFQPSVLTPSLWPLLLWQTAALDNKLSSVWDISALVGGRYGSQWSSETEQSPQNCLVKQHKTHLCSPELCQHCNVADTWKEAMLPSYTEGILVS